MAFSLIVFTFDRGKVNSRAWSATKICIFQLAGTAGLPEVEAVSQIFPTTP